MGLWCYQGCRQGGPKWATAQGPQKFGAPKLLGISSVCTTNIITLCHLIQRQGLSKVRSNKKPACEAFLSVPSIANTPPVRLLLPNEQMSSPAFGQSPACCFRGSTNRPRCRPLLPPPIARLERHQLTVAAFRVCGSTIDYNPGLHLLGIQLNFIIPVLGRFLILISLT